MRPISSSRPSARGELAHHRRHHLDELQTVLREGPLPWRCALSKQVHLARARISEGRGLSCAVCPSLREKSHGIYLPMNAVVAAAELSARYLAGRQLALQGSDVLDTACRRVPHQPGRGTRCT